MAQHMATSRAGQETLQGSRVTRATLFSKDSPAPRGHSSSPKESSASVSGSRTLLTLLLPMPTIFTSISSHKTPTHSSNPTRIPPLPGSLPYLPNGTPFLQQGLLLSPGATLPHRHGGENRPDVRGGRSRESPRWKPSTEDYVTLGSHLPGTRTPGPTQLRQRLTEPSLQTARPSLQPSCFVVPRIHDFLLAHSDLLTFAGGGWRC